MSQIQLDALQKQMVVKHAIEILQYLADHDENIQPSDVLEHTIILQALDGYIKLTFKKDENDFDLESYVNQTYIGTFNPELSILDARPHNQLLYTNVF